MEAVQLPKNVETRLLELSQLRDGWLDGVGKGITSTVIENATKLLKQCILDGLQLPYLGPLESGDLIAQWTKKKDSHPLTVVVTVASTLFDLSITTDSEEFEIDDVAKLTRQLVKTISHLENWFPMTTNQ